MAPNPFWGICTLAVCTPNHQGSRLDVGNWIAGFLTKERGYKFLYAMEISEILGLDEYFRDQRFASKKPKLSGSWRERCGDNFYSRRDDGTWIQHENIFHMDEQSKRQDTKHARVFIGQRFWYRGRSAEPVPVRFAPLAGRRGARVNHEPGLVSEFCAWVSTEFEPGIAAVPNDNPDMDGDEDLVMTCGTRVPKGRRLAGRRGTRTCA
jgi:hypothetical protein